MKYVISRASDWSGSTAPCDNASIEEIEYVMHWNYPTLKEAMEHRAFNRIDTFNHKETKNGTCCSIKQRVWVIDSTIEELFHKYGSLIIEESNAVEYPIKIVIYDSYVE